MNIDLTGKVALVTGGSRGIGRSICLGLASLGATVYVNYSSRSDAADETVAMCEDLKGNAIALGFDVSSSEAVDTAIKKIKEDSERLDILVNNAGITRDNIMLRMKEEEWDDIIDTNLKSVFRLSKAVLRGMTKARFGRIINITSVVGVSGNAGQANYSASKAGVIGFTKSLGQEIATRGITVNAVAPGFIATDMTEALTDDQKAAINQAIPAGRMGQPEEIAAAVAFLASQGAAYITGTTLHINGGMYMS